MKHHIVIILLLCLFVPLLSYAQTLTNRERRNINSKALLLVEEYERYASLYDDDAVYFFGNLFKEDAKIVSDMMGSQSYLKSISTTEYIDQLRNTSVNTTTVVKNVYKGQLQYIDDEWHIPITFQKSLSYIDKNGYIFSVDDFYANDISVMMDLVYDVKENSCFIASINSSIDSDKRFPEGRFLIIDRKNEELKHNRYFESLMIEGEPIQYNKLGLAMIEANSLPSLKNIDVEVDPFTITEGFNYDVISFKYKSRNLRLKPYLAFAPFSAYKIEKNANSDKFNTKTGAVECGLDMGFTFPIGQKSKMGLYFGVGVSNSYLELSLKKPYNYDYNAPKYNVNTNLFEDKIYKYTITSVAERIKYIDLFAPLYLGFESYLGRNLLLSFNIGAKAYLNMYEIAEPYKISYKVKNKEEVIFKNLTPKKYIIPTKYDKNPFDICAITNIALDVNLYKQRMYLMVQVGYEYGFTDSYVSNSLKNINKPPIVIPNMKDGNNEDIAVFSPINGIQTRRNAVWLTTGLKFKL